MYTFERTKKDSGVTLMREKWCRVYNHDHQQIFEGPQWKCAMLVKFLTNLDSKEFDKEEYYDKTE